MNSDFTLILTMQSFKKGQLLVFCMANEQIEQGDKVKVDYEGKLDSGEVFDSTKHGEHSHPLEFSVGGGQIIPAFEEAVKGMAEGEEKWAGSKLFWSTVPGV